METDLRAALLRRRQVAMACAGAMLLALGWMLTTYGLTLVVVHSSIMAPLRTLLAPWPFFGRLVHCPMCFGWWSGALCTLAFALALARRLPLRLPLTPFELLLLTFAGAFASAGLNWVLFVATSRLGALRHLGMEEDLPPKIVSSVRGRR